MEEKDAGYLAPLQPKQQSFSVVSASLAGYPTAEGVCVHGVCPSNLNTGTVWSDGTLATKILLCGYS